MMRAMTAAAVLALAAGSAAAQEWRSLFNGKDFSGWETWLAKPHRSSQVPGLRRNDKGEYLEPVGLDKDPTNVYSVVMVDGEPAVRISGEIWGALTTKEEFGNYHLRFEVKWGERKWPPREKTVRDSGVLYHCVGPHGAGSGAWMKSFESQIQENDFGDFHSVAGVIVDVEADVVRGRRKDPKTGQEREVITKATFRKGGEKLVGWTSRIIRNPLSEKPHGEWNVVDIYCFGATAVHVNNGKVNMVLTNLRHKVDGREVPLTKGRIQFQSEAAEVFFRRIEIRPITAIPDELLK